MRIRLHTSILFLILFAGALASIMIALTTGPADISMLECFLIVFNRIKNISTDINETAQTIILSIRLPRVMLAFIVGAGLACVGSVYQSILSNPLADPYILGTSSGAALGASIAMIMGISNMLIVPTAAFTGSCIALILVYLLARTGNRLPMQTLLLAGVVVNAFLFALVMFILSYAGRDSGLILMWLLGSLSATEPRVTAITFVFIFVSFILLLRYSWHINIISLGDDKAVQLGVNTEKLKKITLILTSLIVGASVSAAGLIGFVGLIIPHTMRFFTGPNQQKLLPASLLGGGILLVLCDTLARSLISPQELPVGVLTALCGAPFFLYILKTSRIKHG
ncbi:MAG: iron chelate uptake ABC transporter family permease subunit [Elusimicrobia bacterium]|nr:iron chelate uptake ABC transporter family permease subunit [Elusimicrobiota bacterium]MBD3411762.1 iron chelate uptake ABC transporter family permease subunit [Elusimicrobiota bacterium]